MCRREAIGACVGIYIFGMCLDESGIDKANCRRKMASGGRVAGPHRSLDNASGLYL